MRDRRSVDIAVPEHISKKFESSFRHLLASLPDDSFSTRYLKEEVFSKYLDETLVPSNVRAAAAIAKFRKADDRNGVTSLRLFEAQAIDHDFGWVSFSDLVNVTRALIARVLGPLRYPDVLMFSTFTNGASVRVRRGPAAACVKVTGELHITDSAIKHWLAMASGSRLSKQPLRVVPSSVLFTVPKKTDIDRVACKEPEGNALLQRSVGIFIAQRLARVGINLHDQSRNQRLAKRAWKDGLATIDLSSASDTVSQGVVQLLLPFDWWSLMSDLRCDSTVLPDGSTMELEMFSSMGNGFTFELETLIFWALAQATKRLSSQRGIISVYGDDIVMPTIMARRFMRVLHFFGFLPNEKKTHYTGPFRESCGHHYWKGLNVTPFYYREGITELPEMINILNRLLEWDGRDVGFIITEEVYRFWKRWRDYIPKFLWGGISPDDPTCLVTGHSPRKRLIPVTEQIKVAGAAKLTTWLHRGDGRDGAIEAPLVVDPALPIGWETERVISAGERSAWYPSICWE